MLSLFIEKNNKLEQIEDVNDFNKIEKNMWIHLAKPTRDDVKAVCDITGLDNGRLEGALDPEEAAHVDFDGDNLITLDVPVWHDNVCETVPFVIMYNADYFVTLCNEDTPLINLVLRNKKIEPQKRNRMAIQIMFRITSLYIQSLRKLDRMTNNLEAKIKTSTKNKEIFDLMDINKSLIYLSTSLNSNKNVFLKLEKIGEFKMYEADNDLMDDVLIENNQAIEMCHIHREILDSMLSAFASITSNNLNIVMKLLAIITLVLALPTLISSIYGMNVNGLPFHNNRHAFWIIIAISVLIAVIGAVALIKCTNYAIKQKKNKVSK